MPEIDREIMRTARRVRRMYLIVFGETPDLEWVTLPGGDPAVVVSEWLVLFHAGIDDRWTVRCLVPEGDDWFAKFPCLARLHGRECEKPNLMEAIVYLVALESHRRVHFAIDADRTLAGMAHA